MFCDSWSLSNCAEIVNSSLGMLLRVHSKQSVLKGIITLAWPLNPMIGQYLMEANHFGIWRENGEFDWVIFLLRYYQDQQWWLKSLHRTLWVYLEFSQHEQWPCNQELFFRWISLVASNVALPKQELTIQVGDANFIKINNIKVFEANKSQLLEFHIQDHRLRQEFCHVSKKACLNSSEA